MVALTPKSYLQQRPDTSDSFFSSAFLLSSSTLRTPFISVAMGFSQKMCLPASTAYSKCIGRKWGGEQSNTTSQLSITFLYPSHPMCVFSSMTSKRSLTTAFRFRLDFAILTRSSNMSAMAYRRAPGSAFRAFSAAPLPRPPQPIKRPSIRHFPMHRQFRATRAEVELASALAAAAVCKKLRRWLVPVKSSLGLSCIVSEIDVGSFWFNWESP